MSEIVSQRPSRYFIFLSAVELPSLTPDSWFLSSFFWYFLLLLLSVQFLYFALCALAVSAFNMCSRPVAPPTLSQVCFPLAEAGVITREGTFSPCLQVYLTGFWPRSLHCRCFQWQADKPLTFISSLHWFVPLMFKCVRQHVEFDATCRNTFTWKLLSLSTPIKQSKYDCTWLIQQYNIKWNKFSR